MNNVSLIGRLTADPELRHTQSGLAMTRFTVAVDRPYVKQGEERQADFISIIAWRQTAEFICKYFAKGRRIAINGEIRTGSYTDNNGVKRYTTDVLANNVEFCDSKPSGSNNGGYQNSYQNNSYSQNGYDRQSAPAAQYSQPYDDAPPAPQSSYSSGSEEDFVGLPSDDDLPF